jgi:chromate transporter
MEAENIQLSKLAKCRIVFCGFFKIAAVVVGGGYAIVPAAEEEFIRRRKLLDETELLDMMAIIQSLPGIIAGNAALYIGYRCAGVWGALAGLIGVAMPSVLIILLIAIFLQDVNLQIPAIQGAFTGAQAAITGLIALTAIRMIRKTVKTTFALVLATASAAAAIIFALSPVWIILSGAVLGIVWRFSQPLCHKKQSAQAEPER